MNDFEDDYLIAANTYQAEQSVYLEVSKRKRLHMISDSEYCSACIVYQDALQSLIRAESMWIASWR